MSQIKGCLYLALLEFRLLCGRPAAIFLLALCALLPIFTLVSTPEATTDLAWALRKEIRFVCLVILPLLACIIGSTSRQNTLKAHSSMVPLSAFSQVLGLVSGRVLFLTIGALLVVVVGRVCLSGGIEGQIWQESAFPVVPISRLTSGDSVEVPLPKTVGNQVAFDIRFAIVLNDTDAPRRLAPLTIELKGENGKWQAVENVTCSSSLLRASHSKAEPDFPVVLRITASNPGLDVVLDRANSRLFPTRIDALRPIFLAAFLALVDATLLSVVAFCLASLFSQATALLGSLGLAAVTTLLPIVVSGPSENATWLQVQASTLLNAVPPIPYRFAGDQFRDGYFAFGHFDTAFFAKLAGTVLLICIASLAVAKRDVPAGDFRG